MEPAVNREKPRISLSTLVLVSLGVGIVFGFVLNVFFPTIVPLLDTYILAPTGKVFLRLIQFVVIPLVFSSLVLGLTRVRDATLVGRFTLKLMTIYLLTSALGVVLGMSTALIMQPGSSVKSLPFTEMAMIQQNQSILDWLISLIPVNPMEALSTGNLIQTIFSAALVGVGIQLAGDKANSFVSLIESIYEISEKILSVILYIAPLGVFALVSSVIATQGFELVANLLFYVLGLFIATSIMIALYAILLWAIQAKPIHFFRSFAPSLSLGFGTASSNAALPIVLQDAQTYGIRDDIAGFAVPLGTAIKRDGSAILQSFNALFIAQIFHVPITSNLILTIALCALLVSFSTPGVPGSALITMSTVLSTAGLPLEGVAIVAGVDRLTDGYKTVLNIVGNGSTAILLNRWEPHPSEVVEPESTQLEGIVGE